MDYSRDQLIFQDEPAGSFLKIGLSVMVFGLLAAGLLLWSVTRNEGGVVLSVEALAIGLLFWCLFPRRYQVHENHIRIVLGGPFSVKTGFAGITGIEVTSRTALTINFATALAKTYVIIKKKYGMSIAITPKSAESFVEYADRAWRRWQENNRSPGLARPFK
jgi:hypothetical protein